MSWLLVGWLLLLVRWWMVSRMQVEIWILVGPGDSDFYMPGLTWADYEAMPVLWERK